MHAGFCFARTKSAEENGISQEYRNYCVDLCENRRFCIDIRRDMW